MKGKNQKQTKRIRNMIIFLGLTGIILSISTYAWFIGMRTVGVNSFDVEIASTESLELSLDGVSWSDTVTINETNFNDPVHTYAGNTNWWAGRGLIPASTIGEIDTASSRLIMFEKAGLTAATGGYRLMASRIPNEGAEEVDGYVAFDLFIKNHTGRQYIKQLRPADEEAIYLTTNSAVTVADVGGQPDTGIENSVRVAFAEIGRVVGTTTTGSIITGITCTDDTNVTGICRDAQIWEPNDQDHVQNAINWYETACEGRTDATTFGGTCGTVLVNKPYPTYAIGEEIASEDNVNIYDGAEFNGYTSPILTKMDYFTDSMKMKTGTDRPTFITLAPNSITKVRIYIYLEGQDIDNYDFAQIGKKISVNFGFTKERFTAEDVGYTGPNHTEIPRRQP